MSQTKNIAVIAIHGVGDHRPFDMARDTGNLLGNLQDANGEPVYCAFGERFIRIPVEPVKIPKASHSGAVVPNGTVNEENSWGPLDAALSDRVRKADQTDSKKIDQLFIEGQLAQFVSRDPQACYNCLRLEGARADASGPTRKVHIYDMCWSDLSGVAEGAVSILEELYQLLFHLASVGVNNVKAARLAFLGNAEFKERWTWFDRFQTCAAAALAWPIALFNLILLTLALPIVAASMVGGLQPHVQNGVLTSLLAIDTLGALFVARRYKKAWLVPVVLLLALAVIAGAFFIQVNELPQWVVEVQTLLICFAVSLALVGAYRRRRPGSRVAYYACWAVDIVVSLVLLAVSQSHVGPYNQYAPERLALRFCEGALVCLLLSWVVFFFLMLGALITGTLAARSKPAQCANPDEASAPRRVFLTARLTLSLPATLFLVVTLVFWAGFVVAAQKALPYQQSFQNDDERCREPNTLCFTPATFGAVRPMSVRVLSQDALNKSGAVYLAGVFAILIVCALCVGWAVIPSALFEYRSPTADVADKDCEFLGRWLSRGYQITLSFAEKLLYLGIFLFGPFLVFTYFHPDPFHSWDQWGVEFSIALGTVVMGAGVTLITLGGRVAKLLLGLRPVLRIALDVDNWLREHPRDSNPTALICARYVSLLRFVSQCQEGGGPYDAIIVFAHSQGTVITADLFRFLKRAKADCQSFQGYDSTLKGLDQIPRFFLTVGSPLRQLYARRFPYLYGYAQGFGPIAADLDVKGWLNAYRSGDYVGRSLWEAAPDFDALAARDGWQPWTRVFPVGQTHDEFCLGAGAHTHYWDHTAPSVAKALDGLIKVI